MKKVLYLTLFLLILTIFGCSSGSDVSEGRGDVVSTSIVSNGTIDNISGMITTAAAKDNSSAVIVQTLWMSAYNKFKSYAKYSYKAYRVEYVSQNTSGSNVTLSGLMVVPYADNGSIVNAPILSMQHPTLIERKYSPSNFNLLDAQLSAHLAVAFASSGYIVLVPDYQGLGVNYDPHPYCHTSLGYSVVDLMRVAVKFLSNNSSTLWDKRTYLIGYSEGGYATMVSAKMLQQKHSDEFKVSGAAVLDAPLSLSSSMREIMLSSGPSYSEPYFLPYMIAGYGYIYGSEIEYLKFQNAVISSTGTIQNFSETLYKMMDGSYTSDAINAYMKNVTPWNGPVSILKSEFVNYLSDNGSSLVKALQANDAYVDIDNSSKVWQPSMPLFIVHNTLDDLVPVSNSRAACANYTTLSNVVCKEFLTYIPGFGAIHVGAMPYAMFDGFNWIHSLAYP